MKTAFRALLALGICAEIAVLIVVATSSGTSPAWLLLPLALILSALALLFSGMLTDRRHAGSWAVSLSITSERFGVPRKALALLVSEVIFLASLPWLLRRPSGDKTGNKAGNTAVTKTHPGYKNLRTVVIVIVGLVVVEIVVVHLAVPSEFWRLLLLVLSVYALMVLLGFYASVKSRPHLVTPQALILRHGGRFFCEIPWENVTRISGARPGQGGDITISDNGETRLPVLSEVNVRIDLDPPVTAADLHKGCAEAAAVEIYCDDKKAFLESAEAYQRR
ncbi:hypothetical protein C3B44_07195 [Corynebacterium yudongzhengii]|uniref:Uncharacterized protein n=1 Tax=Corynebacterium yudongzhengii TaxID=2080740 RepID=A0A2U1T466_9CORY|nr:hypothetical protein [Corynebacterium yudongzhengii]AWB82168.1 hypothetical protein C3B44_07195 [Corynebacterium yudongzhengii]PWC00799.1 hypothetical protein DF222_10800 [Corynebacterium yudongzhengii]